MNRSTGWMFSFFCVDHRYRQSRRLMDFYSRKSDKCCLQIRGGHRSLVLWAIRRSPTRWLSPVRSVDWFTSATTPLPHSTSDAGGSFYILIYFIAPFPVPGWLGRLQGGASEKASDRCRLLQRVPPPDPAGEDTASRVRQYKRTDGRTSDELKLARQ